MVFRKSYDFLSGPSCTGSVQSSNAESWIQLASKEGSMSIADIVKKVTPSVVGVQSTFTSTANNSAYNSVSYTHLTLPTKA